MKAKKEVKGIRLSSQCRRNVDQLSLYLIFGSKMRKSKVLQFRSQRMPSGRGGVLANRVGEVALLMLEG